MKVCYAGEAYITLCAYSVLMYCIFYRNKINVTKIRTRIIL